jgi:hypothetical protein
MKPLRCLILIVVAARCAGPAVGADAEKLKDKSFVAVVQERFDKWSREKTLTAAAVVKLIAKASAHGDEAAALVAIHRHQHAHADCAVTKEFLLRPAKSGADAAHLEGDFQAARKRIASATRELFVGHAPTLKAIHQGDRSDCFFLASVGAAIHSNPQRIRRLFQIHDDGSFDVVFSEQHKEHVARLTDAQIGLVADEDDRAEGIWLTALELAMGRRINQALHTAIKHGKGKEMLSLDRIGGGGDPSKIMAQLTGHHIVGLEVEPAATAKIREAAKTAHTYLACLTIGKFKAAPPPGMIAGHCYAIIGYDAQKDAFQIWNPHGNNHKPKGPPGLANGYPTDDGHFSMPLRDLLASVKGTVCHETNQPMSKDDRP